MLTSGGGLFRDLCASAWCLATPVVSATARVRAAPAQAGQAVDHDARFALQPDAFAVSPDGSARALYLALRTCLAPRMRDLHAFPRRNTSPLGQTHSVPLALGTSGRRQSIRRTHLPFTSTSPSGQTQLVPAALATSGGGQMMCRTHFPPINTSPSGQMQVPATAPGTIGGGQPQIAPGTGTIGGGRVQTRVRSRPAAAGTLDTDRH